MEQAARTSTAARARTIERAGCMGRLLGCGAASAARGLGRAQAVQDEIDGVREVRRDVEVLGTRAGQERVLEDRSHDQRRDERANRVRRRSPGGTRRGRCRAGRRARRARSRAGSLRRCRSGRARGKFCASEIISFGMPECRVEPIASHQPATSVRRRSATRPRTGRPAPRPPRSRGRCPSGSPP